MSGNTEVNINSLPAMNYKRSKFRYYKNVKTTFNCGDLITTYANELVQPGDTFSFDVSLVCRMMTPYQPVMDNSWLETFAFAVPWIDIWDHAKEFWGENPNGAWTTNQVEYSTPRVKIPANGQVDRHTLLSYLGFPRCEFTNAVTTGGGLSVNTYISIYNEWFRNQNYIAPITVNKAGTTITYSSTGIINGGQVLKVMKPHTRFTSGLPEPQKSPDGAMSIPLGVSAPVMGTGKGLLLTTTTSTDNTTIRSHLIRMTPTLENGHFLSVNGNASTAEAGNVGYYNTDIYSEANRPQIGVPTKKQLNNSAINPINTGLMADLSAATAATISALRLATAVQQIYEAMGMYGSLYRQIIYSLWGTSVSDTAMHIPEFLGSRKTLINMEQVTATTEGTNQDLGSTGAMSLTNDSFHLFTKSFREHSVIMILHCVRTDAHYSQGWPAQYLKSQKFEYYWNKLAGLSFQPVKVAEVKADPTTGDSQFNNTLSFLPAWSEYRNEQDMLTSMFNPDDALFLQQWTYVNKYTDVPSMGQSFIEETTDNIDRTLYNTSASTDNFMLDITFGITKITEVPFYGTPGLTRF